MKNIWYFAFAISLLLNVAQLVFIGSDSESRKDNSSNDSTGGSNKPSATDVKTTALHKVSSVELESLSEILNQIEAVEIDYEKLKDSLISLGFSPSVWFMPGDSEV